MAYAGIAVGSIWMVLGALMIYVGLFNRSPLPAGLGIPVRVPMPSQLVAVMQVPATMFAATLWLARFSLRAGLGLSGRRSKASR